MYPFLHLDLPTGDFFTETESLGGCLSWSAGFILLVSTRALRAQKIPKNSKHFFKFRKIPQNSQRIPTISKENRQNAPNPTFRA